MKNSLIYLTMFLFLFSCKKYHEVIQPKKVIEDSSSMFLLNVFPSDIELAGIPNPNGCGAGTYQSLLYDGNSAFMLFYGYDGYNLNYVTLDSYSSSFKWYTDHKVWGYDYLSGQIYGYQYYGSLRFNGYFNTSLSFNIVPNSCVIHYHFTHTATP